MVTRQRETQAEQPHADGQSRIHIPVALPPVFLGAPMMPAIVWVFTCVLGMMACFIVQSWVYYGIIFLVLFFPGHGFLMYYGRREPHLSSLMEVYTRGGTKKRGRHIGARRSKRRVFFPG